jgi:hypothetical protein
MLLFIFEVYWAPNWNITFITYRFNGRLLTLFEIRSNIALACGNPTSADCVNGDPFVAGLRRDGLASYT